MKVDIKRTDIISQEDLISARTLSFKDKNLFLINCISTENIATDKKAGKKFSETSRERFNEGLEQSQIDNNTQIEFEIKGSKDEYVDKGKIFLYVIGCLVDDKGNPIANTTICGPVNNFAHSLYQQVQVEYNNTPVNSPVNSYSYHAYLST
jgi:hypothetical protein